MRIKRVGERVLYTNPAVRMMHPRSAAAVVPWWLSGGILAANCLAAYTPKGAASLAASYDNNAAPGNGLPDGTYDAAPGVAPTWNAATGWIGGAGVYLLTGITPPLGAPTWSAVVRFTGILPNQVPFGMRDTSAPTGSFHIYPSDGLKRYYRNGNLMGLSIIGPILTGIMGFAGTTAYLNGVAEAGVIPGTIDGSLPILMLTWNNNGTPGTSMTGSMQAFAVYSTTLTGPQVLAVTTAMAAL